MTLNTTDMGAVRQSTIDNYQIVLEKIRTYRQSKQITSREIEEISKNHQVGNGISTHMVRAGYLTRVKHGTYTVNLKSVEPIHARTIASMATEYANKTKNRAKNTPKPAEAIKPSAFDLLQTDIRVKELDKRLFFIEAQVERHRERLQYLENNTFLQTAPKPKPSLRSRFAARYNKFIQSLTIKS